MTNTSKTRRFATFTSRAAWIGWVLIGALSGGCMGEDHDDGARVMLDRDLRDYAADARAKLHLLPSETRALVEPVLAAHEKAIARYDRLMNRGQTRQAVMTPLVGLGTFIVANDATGAGVADDVALPFLALGALAVALATSSPANKGALADAYADVMNTASDVTNVFRQNGIEDMMNSASSTLDEHASQSKSESKSEVQSEPGTRQYCIDEYVNCKQDAVRGYSRGACQVCMDKCLVNEYEWPEDAQCDYMGTRKHRYPKRPFRKKPVIKI
jgi:hypothetical protein